MSVKNVATLSFVLVASVAFIGCTKSGDKATTKPETQASEKGKAHGEWWCDEHGVPEAICAQCYPKVAADFKAKGDWCKEHDRPDSQCFICHPEKEVEFAAQYEAKYGKKPPKPELTGEKHEHDEKHEHGDASVPASQSQQVLEAAASNQKYTFLVFYKDNGSATQAMAQTVKRGIESRGDRAALAFVDVANPVEKGLVDRFGISRAPMPLTIAVAPNGAMTKLIPTTISDEQIEKSFVTPAMSHCMKSMQDGRLVFVCIQSGAKPTIPAGVRAFSSEPEFKGRVVIVPVQVGDPTEAELVRELESDVAAKGSTTVFLAPPGVLVGKFGPTATKDQLAIALHKAGQCCEDENCKHNQSNPPAGKPAASTSRPGTQTPSTRRN